MGTFSFMLVFGIVLLWLGARIYGRPAAKDRYAHWEHFIENMEETQERFYARVYQTLRDGVKNKEITLVGLGFGPKHLFEGATIFSERPLYLAVTYKHLDFYLYMCQTPVGCYVSTSFYSKYVKTTDRLLMPIAYRYFEKQSIFQHDAAIMFEQSLLTVVQRVVDRYTEEQKLEPLTKEQKKPVHHAFYGGSLPQGMPDRFGSGRRKLPVEWL